MAQKLVSGKSGENPESLKANEVKFRMLAELTDSMMFLYDVNGNIVDFNASAVYQYGYTKKELFSLNIGDIAPDFMQVLKETDLSKTTDANDVIHIKTNHHRKDGSQFPAEISLTTLKTGDHTLIMALCRDKTREQKNQKRQDILESILKVAPAGIGMVRNRTIFQANDQLCEMTGYRQKELVGENARILYPSDDDYNYVGDEKYRQIKAYGTGSVETRWQRKNGEIMDILLCSTPTDQKDLSKGVIFTALDISTRKQAERSIKKREALYREYFEEILSGAFITTPDGQLLECNQEYAKIFGFSSIKEALKSPVDTLYEDPATRVRFLDNIKKKKGLKYFESVMHKQDGTLIHILENAVGVFDENGTLTSIRGYLSDISELKTMEARLSQAQKMEAVGTLVGGITHDFNNILQAISGYAEVLMIKKDKDHPEYMNLSAMRRAIKRAGKLVQQLLIFSRKAQSQKKPLEINQEVKQAKNLLEKTIPKMIEIRTDLAKNLLQVHADPVQIEQVILNLGSNAADAMPQGGKIYIKTSNVTIDHNNITDHAGTVMGNHILLSISDNGHGMDAETLDKIFEPFFTTKSPGKGTGLGLSSVYGIVQNHGGNILCNSEESKGTTFKIYLPAMSEKIEEEATKEEFEARGGNETVLVVDDEDEIRKMTSVAFNHFGYTYLEAANGEKALEIYKELSNEIDLVILDISMPGMGGYKCLQALLALNPAVKTLIASGYSAEANIEDCLKLGAKGYIAKPYQFNGLLAQVRKILDQN